MNPCFVYVFLDKELRSLQSQITTYEDEMQTPLIVSLSEEEREEIQVLIERSQQLQGKVLLFFSLCVFGLIINATKCHKIQEFSSTKCLHISTSVPSGDVGAAEQQVVQVNTERERCRVDLRDNLLKRQAELEATLSSLLGTGTGAGVSTVEDEDEGGHEESKSSHKGRKNKKNPQPKSTSSSGYSATEASDQALLQEAETQCEVELQRVSQSVREQESEVSTPNIYYYLLGLTDGPLRLYSTVSYFVLD